MKLPAWISRSLLLFGLLPYGLWSIIKIGEVMNTFLKLLFLMVNLIYITTNIAQAVYLEPISDDYHDSYRRQVCEILVPKTELIASTIVFPSFEPEWGIFLIQNQEGYQIFLNEAQIQISENLKNVKKSQNFLTFHKPLDKNIAEKIKALWVNQILKCRFPKEPSQGLDGTDYEFGVFVLGYGYLQAKAWSPQKSDPKKMVEITDLFKKFCKQRNDKGSLKEIELLLK